MELLDSLRKLAEAFFVPFSKAVTEYPITTLVVLVTVAIYVNNTKFIELIREGKFRTLDYNLVEISKIIIVFIASIMISFFVGYLLSLITGLLSYIQGASAEVFSPFKKYPVEFTTFIVLFSALSLIFVGIITRLRIHTTPPALVILLAFSVLFASYVSTSIYIGLRGDRGAASRSAAPANQ